MPNQNNHNSDASINPTRNTVLLYHNVNCSKSRAAIEYLSHKTAELGVALEVREYLTQPLGADELTALLQQLPEAPTELVRKDKNFAALALDPNAYDSAASVVSVLTEHPNLMQRPIAVYKDKARIGRPTEALEDLFS